METSASMCERPRCSRVETGPAAVGAVVTHLALPQHEEDQATGNRSVTDVHVSRAGRDGLGKLAASKRVAAADRDVPDAAAPLG